MNKWASAIASQMFVYFTHHLSNRRDWLALIKNKIYGIHDSRIPFIEMHLVKLDASGLVHRVCVRARAILFHSISFLILYKCMDVFVFVFIFEYECNSVEKYLSF